jgi:hypothetical protein
MTFFMSGGGGYSPQLVTSTSRNKIAAMSLDEHENPVADDRCEECGAKLTSAEMQAVRESGGPVLCSIHAAEDEPGLAAGDDSAAFGE